jgi:hypothetical protein
MDDADAQNDTKDENQDARSLFLDKPQDRSRSHKIQYNNLAMEVGESYCMIHRHVRNE